MQTIMSWSQDMFNTAIKVTDLGDDPATVEDDDYAEESLFGIDYTNFAFEVVQEYYGDEIFTDAELEEVKKTYGSSND